MVFVIVAMVVEGGGEYAGRTAVGAAARCWDGAGCEMRGWGEGEGGGVDPAAPWMTPLVTTARDAGTGRARLRDAGTGRARLRDAGTGRG
jgi:hypothetical protein